MREGGRETEREGEGGKKGREGSGENLALVKRARLT